MKLQILTVLIFLINVWVRNMFLVFQAVKKWSSSIWCRDSNPQPLECESSRITTTWGLLLNRTEFGRRLIISFLKFFFESLLESSSDGSFLSAFNQTLYTWRSQSVSLNKFRLGVERTFSRFFCSNRNYRSSIGL